MEVVIKIEVKDNNVEQALRVLKENFKEMVFQSHKVKKYLREAFRKEKENSARKYKKS